MEASDHDLACVKPDFLSVRGDVLTVVVRGAGIVIDVGQSVVAGCDQSQINCYRSVSDSAAKNFIRTWKLNSEKKDFSTKIRLTENQLSNSGPGGAEIMLNYKGQSVSSCGLRKITADEAISTFLEERLQDRKTIQELQTTLKNLIVEKNLMEDSMYRSFAKCLNSKKERIKELQERLGCPDAKIPTPDLTKKEKIKAPVKQKQKRKCKNFSNPESEDSAPEVTSKPAHSSTVKELYNDDTETESDEGPGPSKSKTAKAKQLVIVSSSSGSETDFDGDVDALVLSTKSLTPSNSRQEAGLGVEKNNNVDKGPSPSKQTKLDPNKADSDPMSKYDKDLLLDNL